MSCFVLRYVGSQVPTKGPEDDGASFTSSLTRTCADQCSPVQQGTGTEHGGIICAGAGA